MDREMVINLAKMMGEIDVVNNYLVRKFDEASNGFQSEINKGDADETKIAGFLYEMEESCNVRDSLNNALETINLMVHELTNK